MKGDEKLETEVAVIGGLSREELIDRWIKAHGRLPPTGARNELLIRSASWHLQARRLGGFSPETKRRLKEAIRRVEDEAQRKAGRRSGKGCSAVGVAKDVPPPEIRRQALHPGARLLRERNGWTHVVDVVENGFVFEGKIFSSLSAVARQITGVRWSGPRFFGL